MTALVVVVVLTVGVSAVCSLLEATLYSTSLATLEAARDRGGHRARAAAVFLELKRDVTSATSAILIVNTVANTAGATLVGVLAVRAFGASAMTPVSIALTLAILFLAEILPKSYAATRWREVWPWAGIALAVMIRALRPLLWLVDALIGALRRRGDDGVPKQEIRAVIRLGRRTGSLNQTEAEILDAALNLSQRRCRDVVVPAPSVVAVCAGDVAGSAVELIERTLHTRYPVCRGDLDTCLGFVHAKDLLSAPADRPLVDLMRPILRLEGESRLHDALRRMQRERVHMAVVMDPDGHALGIATLEDVLEQVVGPVMDEFDATRVAVAQSEPRPAVDLSAVASK